MKAKEFPINRFVDVEYFERELVRLRQKLKDQTPDELGRYFTVLAQTADVKLRDTTTEYEELKQYADSQNESQIDLVTKISELKHKLDKAISLLGYFKRDFEDLEVDGMQLMDEFMTAINESGLLEKE